MVIILVKQDVTGVMMIKFAKFLNVIDTQTQNY